MIYLVTGVPGAGKSLYAVSKLVQELAAQTVTIDGVETKRRIVVDNIPNLLLEHELMDPGKLVQGQIEPGEGHGVWNWHKWCKPGDVIVIDEVQRHWRPRGAGTKAKEEVAMLETHRHFGVDFVIITQSPMLLDQNVRRLVGRHQHVRRVLGMARAIIYDWDSCSTSLAPATATAKSFFNYPKSAYALYKSSELHTKQKQKIPAFIIVPILAVVLGVLVLPKAFGVMSGAASGKGISEAVKGGVLPVAAAPSPVMSSSSPAQQAVSISTLADTIRPPPLPPQYAGCIVVRDRCGCFDDKGKKVEIELEACHAESGHGRSKPVEFADSPRSVTLDADQLDAYRFAFLKN